MFTRKSFFVIASVLIVFLGFFSGRVALAHNPENGVKFEYEFLRTIEPGRIWSDKEGLHIRGRIDLGTVSGDLQGAARVIYNADLPALAIGPETPDVPVPYSGIAYGTIEIFGELTEAIGPSWNGSWTYYLHQNNVVSGNLQATNTSETLMLIAPTVFQARSGSVVHVGSIDNLFCMDAGCEDPSLK